MRAFVYPSIHGTITTAQVIIFSQGTQDVHRANDDESSQSWERPHWLRSISVTLAVGTSAKIRRDDT